MNKIKYICVAFLLFLTMLLSSCTQEVLKNPSSHSDSSQTEALIESNSKMNMTFLEVGKADAIPILIEDKEQNKKYCVLVDTGEEDDSEEIFEFLKNNEIDSIDYMIISHYDKDHVGGAPEIIKTVNVKNVLVPDYVKDNVEYQLFSDALKSRGISQTVISKPLELTFSNVTVSIIPAKDPNVYIPIETTKDYDNNLSLVTKVVHGKNSFLLTGDIEKSRINELLESKIEPCTVLKVPHHGVFSKASESLVNALTPQYAVICCSNKNPASKEVLNILSKHKVKTFCTNNGHIQCLSNGVDLKFTNVK